MTFGDKCLACSKIITKSAWQGMHYACFRKAFKRLDRKNKYGAVRSESKLAGRTFDSGLERKRGEELALLEKGGAIADLRFQEVVELTAAKIRFKTDFSYFLIRNAMGFEPPDTPRQFEETKGIDGERWRIIKNLWVQYGPGDLHIFKANRDGDPERVEVIRMPSDWKKELCRKCGGLREGDE